LRLSTAVAGAAPKRGAYCIRPLARVKDKPK
jgi:hypothetical protein